MARSDKRPASLNLVVKEARILDPSQGLDFVGNLLIQGGILESVEPPHSSQQMPANTQVIHAKGLVVTPGFVDLHCHLREPGNEDKETIATGTMAAAKGGFSTICCMPNTNPPLDTVALVEFVKTRARQHGTIRVLPIGCITLKRAGLQLAPLPELARAGVIAFSDDGDPVSDTYLLHQALSYSQQTGLPIINHPQDISLTNGGVMHAGDIAKTLGLPEMPSTAEETMVARDIALAELTGGHLHLAHLSTAGSVALVRMAKKRGVSVTAEVTPHHLVLTDEWVVSSPGTTEMDHPMRQYNTATKVNPPLRTQADVLALRQGLKEGSIDAIATDHAPHTLADKMGTYQEAAFGISGLETALGLIMSLVHEGVIDLSTLIHRLTAGPAAVLGLPFGSLQTGSLADVTIIDPQYEWIVEPEAFVSKGHNTPLAGYPMKGKVLATISQGVLAYNNLAITINSHTPS